MNQNPYNFRPMNNNGDRQFFFPFYNVAPYRPYPPMGPGPYGNYSYNYYFPYGR